MTSPKPSALALKIAESIQSGAVPANVARHPSALQSPIRQEAADTAAFIDSHLRPIVEALDGLIDYANETGPSMAGFDAGDAEGGRPGEDLSDVACRLVEHARKALADLKGSQ